MPKTKGKITVACECGETLEVPASIKGEFDCACGKTYTINKEKIVEKGGYPVPYPVYPRPYVEPRRPYIQPWDRYRYSEPAWISAPNTRIGIGGTTVSLGTTTGTPNVAGLSISRN